MEKVRSTPPDAQSAQEEAMSPSRYFVGIDVASEQFHAAIGTAPWRVLVKATAFPNTSEGFDQFRTWLTAQSCTPSDTVLCMEATGVYGEALAYFLAAQGFRVGVEPPLRVKRAFKPHSSKTDAVDSQQLAEYACRYADQLSVWQPRPELLEQLNVLLSTREQLVKQRTAHKNSLHALQRKVVRTSVAEGAHQHLVTALTAQIKTVEQEIQRLFKQDPPCDALRRLLLTIPGVGLLLAAQFLVLTHCGTTPRRANQLAAHTGIAPLEHQSGKSVRGRTTSRHFGPAPMRKLLHLGARSVSTHNAQFRTYYQRKLAEGKPKRLVLNNVANKLLKVMCAVMESQTPYDPNYHPVRLAPARAA
jgi:transposase